MGTFNPPPAGTGLHFRREGPSQMHPTTQTPAPRVASLPMTTTPAGPRSLTLDSPAMSGKTARERSNPRDRVLWAITWNVERDRDRNAVRRELHALVRQGVDVIALQEVAQYGAILAALPDYRLLRWDLHRGQSQNALLVHERHSLIKGQNWCARMTWRGWTTVTGRETPPMWAPTALVGGVRFIAAHLPVSVKHTTQTDKIPAGPARRVAAYAMYARRLAKLINAAPLARPVVVLADWNAPRWTQSRWSPGWIAHRAFLHMAWPPRRTSKHRQAAIDYALYRRCQIDKPAILEALRHGSDHDPVIFRITPGAGGR